MEVADVEAVTPAEVVESPPPDDVVQDVRRLHQRPRFKGLWAGLWGGSRPSKSGRAETSVAQEIAFSVRECLPPGGRACC